MLRLYAAALPPLPECAVRIPKLQIVRLHLAAAYSQSGQIAEARAEAAAALRINPRFTSEKWRDLAIYRNPKDTEHRIDGLRKAGARVLNRRLAAGRSAG